MHDVYVSRYVDRSIPEVIDRLLAVGSTGPAAEVRIGPAIRLHDWMAVVPVSWHQEGVTVLDGELRVITVAGGSHAISEVLLAGRRGAATPCDPGPMLDTLVAGIEAVDLADA